ncbi:MAG: GGDEF domain-containing protein [Aquabacterium sp.]|nr:MAG: GGDEF domain-containing protein [Aquabacterium sp.]
MADPAPPPPFAPSSQPAGLRTAGAPAPPTVEMVGALLSRGSLALRFPAEIEARFEADAADERRRWMVLTVLGQALALLCFIYSDYHMVPDRWPLAVWLRLGLLLPACLLLAWLIARSTRPAEREWLAMASNLVSGAVGLLVIVPSDSPRAPAYLVSLWIIALYANVVQRLRFPQAIGLGAVTFMAQAWAVQAMPACTAYIAVPVTLIGLSTLVFTLYAGHTLEREERHAWLMGLRQSALQRELARANDILHQASRRDTLTGLANRRHFDEFIAQVWERARQDGSPVSVIVVDVDHFKQLNDRLGHLAGDDCLRGIAACLQRCLRRPADLVARIGGEEFAVVLGTTPHEQACQAAERVRGGVLAEERLQRTGAGGNLPVSISLGVATHYPHAGGGTPLALMQDADAALYAAKAAGRNCVRSASARPEVPGAQGLREVSP